MSAVTGLFNDKDSAERAYQYALDSGYGSNDIDVIMSTETHELHYCNHRMLETEVGNKSTEAGALASTVAASGTVLALPSLSLVVAGPLAAEITDAESSSLSAGLVGALIDWAIPDDTVEEYEIGLKNGGIIIGVNAKSSFYRDRFKDDLNTNNSQHERSKQFM